jgi:D-3-phosphoglycerate dehydrogenase
MAQGLASSTQRFTAIVPPSSVLRETLDVARQLVLAAGHQVVSPEAPPEQWGGLIAEASMIVLTPRGRFPPELMVRASKLRSIVFPTLGVDPVEVAVATRLGIAIAHSAPAESAHSMAEATVALIAMLFHRLPKKQAVLVAGGWREPLILGRTLRGKTVGLVGFGRIGRAVAGLLAPWGVRLLFADPAIEEGEVMGAVRTNLQHLLQESDLVSLHTALSDGTRGMIGREEIAAMKPGAYLVNTARGGLVDEDALADALEQGRLAGAAIDAFETEPLPQDSRLRRCQSVILTPHNAGHSVELMEALTECMVENLDELLAGRPPRYIYNPDALELWRRRFSAAA